METISHNKLYLPLERITNPIYEEDTSKTAQSAKFSEKKKSFRESIKGVTRSISLRRLTM